jgi:rubrerythrin
MIENTIKEELRCKLEKAICAERTIATCFRHLSSLIKNGNIRKTLKSFSESSQANESLLKDNIRKLGVEDVQSKNECKICALNPENFSTLGAINMGIDVTKAAEKFYKGLLSLSGNINDKKTIKRIITEKVKQEKFLKKEKKFSKGKEDDMISKYCMPEIISPLWK